MKCVAYAIFTVAAAGAAVPALASSTFPVGFSAGVYLPTDREMRDAFGSSLFSVGFGFAGTKLAHNREITPNVNIIIGQRNTNSFTLIPVTLGYEEHFGIESSRFQPYARLDAGVAYYDYAIDRGAERLSNKTFGVTSSIEAGLVINKRIQLSAAYRMFSMRDQLTFNGLQLSLTAQLFKF